MVQIVPADKVVFFSGEKESHYARVSIEDKEYGKKQGHQEQLQFDVMKTWNSRHKKSCLRLRLNVPLWRFDTRTIMVAIEKMKLQTVAMRTKTTITAAIGYAHSRLTMMQKVLLNPR